MKPEDALKERSRNFGWIILGACVLGVALQMDLSAADPLAPKSFYFMLAACGLIALAKIRFLRGGTLSLPRGSLGLAGCLLVLVQGLAWALSPLRLNATNGALAWVLVLMLFVGAYDLLQFEDAWLRLLRGLALATALAGLWSVVQALGWDPSALGQASVASFGPRIAGCLGNPNFAGGFFVLMLPVMVWACRRDPRWWGRTLAGKAAVFAAFGLILSASKAAFLGLAVEVAVASHLFFWSEAAWGARRKALLAMGLVVAVLAAAALVALPAASRQRLISGWQAGAESVQFRRLTWEGALKAVEGRPVLGWGPGNFEVVYPGYRLSAAMVGLAQRSYEVSHAENWVVQTLVESGVLGLLALIFFLLCLLWPLRLAAKAWAGQELSGGLSLALLTALAGSLACNLASLDLYLPSTLLPFTLLAALAASVAGLPVLALRLKPTPLTRSLSGALVALLCWPLLIAAGDWQASALLAQAKGFSAANRFDEAIPLYLQALRLDPRNLEARYFLASSYQDRHGPQDFADAEREYLALQQQAPDYVLLHAKLARLYTQEGRLDEAAAQWQRQLQIDPYLMPAVQELSSLYAGHGRLAEAQAVLAAAVLRFPDDAALKQNLATVDAALARKGKLR